MYKSSVLSTIILLFSLFANAQPPHVIPLQTTPSDVTVYLEGARISRPTQVSLKKGQNQLEFRGLSSQLDRQSLQFTSDHPLSVLSISIINDYDQKLQRNQAVMDLQNELKQIDQELLRIQSVFQAWKHKESLLNANLKFGGNDKITVDDLQKMNAYLEKESLTIHEKMMELDREKTLQQLNRDTVSQKLLEVSGIEALGLMVRVLVESENDENVNCNLAYIVNQCGWYPEYDLRASETTEEVRLDYKALVYNNTGNDWNDMKLTLSTGMPQVTADLPDLAPWYIDQQSFGYMQSRNLDNGKIQSVNKSLMLPKDLEPLEYQAMQQVRITDVLVSEISTLFRIEKNYTIPSDFLPYFIPVEHYILPAFYRFAAVPKLEQNAFLLASITDWESLNLVQGPASVYYGEAYRGKIEINTYETSDTLSFSLGRDDKLVTQVKKLKEYSKKQAIGGNRKDTYTFEIALKNTRTLPVSLKVYDQIPVSNDSEIEISTGEISGAELNPYNGKLTWELNLAPGETRRFRFSYTVKYPKNKRLNSGNYKKYQSMRYF